MRKKIYILIITTVLLLVILVYNFNKVTKGYDLNKVGSDISVKGELVSGNEFKFHTFVQLGKEEPLSSSIIELNIRTQIESDKSTNTYVLKNPKFQITPIGCEQYANEEEFTNQNEYSATYQFGIKPNQSFKQTMNIGNAKLLLHSKNIKINNITTSNNKLFSISSLKRSTNNDSTVTVDFNTLTQYYGQWYGIKFIPISHNEGIFRVE